MSDQTSSSLNKAHELIQSDALRPKAKALLLLKLSQLYSLFSLEKAKEFWQKLQKVQNRLSGEDQTRFTELSQILTEEKEAKKGFAGDKIAEINAMMSKPDLTESALRTFLLEKEEEVNKRFWPGGKEAVWERLVSVWKSIDRAHALSLTSKLSPAKRQHIVKQMNREKTLSLEEWQDFKDASSQNDAVNVITAILDDPNPKLTIPAILISPVVSGLLKKMVNIQQLHPTLQKINKFLALVTKQDNKSQVFEAVKDSVKQLILSTAIGRQWAERFNAILNQIVMGSSLGVITRENKAQLVKVLTKHMQDFGLASCTAVLTDQDHVQEDYDALLQSVDQKVDAEAWFLVLLAERKLGNHAYKLALASPNHADLIPRVSRAWLLNDPESAALTVQPTAIQDDIVAQILIRTDRAERVAFLREMTQHGNTSLPDAVWTARPPEEERKSFWASLWSGGKTFDQVFQEYLDRNPLYGSYRLDTQPAKQFTEYQRFKGYGEYSCKRIDPILLEGLILWGDEHPEEVRTVLNRMWQRIEPDDDILKLDFLRNAIFGRCTTVLAANPQVLKDQFVAWLKKKLIDHSISWQMGKTQYTVRYPDKAQASMCLQGALAVQTLSPERRDRLVEYALTNFPADDALAELGAQLYNSGKEVLDIQLPWKTKSNVVEGWQVGIVKNAIPELIKEIVAEEQPAS